ncbi:hypothetical protein [Marinilabilia rubra]|uniref:AbrB/MazE/SpoVT family DNA-binding domain-containing protein n=1 Tax=Marinilabilia rubra TaxID=2162893 RepID=A0A2U2BAC5_9BACT|nr:hypothetical protein [Marinilabilia rubra]PWE00020.1 hypothetical protein DDZ16_06555 [Marinilabilia rubra]
MKKERGKENNDQSFDNSGDSSKKNVRQGWDNAAREAHENGDDKLMLDFDEDFEQDGWIW